MDEQLVIESRAGSILTLALNRPQALNSFTGAMHEALASSLDAAAADRGVRCLVLTGQGRAFCAGQDLADPLVAPNPDPNGPADRRRRPDRAPLPAVGDAPAARCRCP